MKLEGPCQVHPAALPSKCERLQIAGSQKGIAWTAVSQPHLPMALLTQAHSLGPLASLATSNFKGIPGVPAGCLPHACFNSAYVSG